MRLFFAVPLSDEVRSAIEGAIGDFPIEDPPWKWIKSENLHITLKFIGEVEEGVLDPLRNAGVEVASKTAPFIIRYGPFGGFPSLSRPRVLFYSVSEGVSELARLAEAVEKEVSSLGFSPERRAFKAHVTLARVKKPLDGRTREKLRSVAGLPEGTIQRVEYFSLFRSHLRRDGAVYEELERFALRAGVG